MPTPTPEPAASGPLTAAAAVENPPTKSYEDEMKAVMDQYNTPAAAEIASAPMQQAPTFNAQDTMQKLSDLQQQLQMESDGDANDEVLYGIQEQINAATQDMANYGYNPNTGISLATEAANAKAVADAKATSDAAAAETPSIVGYDSETGYYVMSDGHVTSDPSSSGHWSGTNISDSAAANNNSNYSNEGRNYAAPSTESSSSD